MGVEREPVCNCYLLGELRRVDGRVVHGKVCELGDAIARARNTPRCSCPMVPLVDGVARHMPHCELSGDDDPRAKGTS